MKNRLYGFSNEIKVENKPKKIFTCPMKYDKGVILNAIVQNPKPFTVYFQVNKIEKETYKHLKLNKNYDHMYPLVKDYLPMSNIIIYPGDVIYAKTETNSSYLFLKINGFYLGDQIK